MTTATNQHAALSTHQLRSLTFDDMQRFADYSDYKETEGIGRQQGICYRSATVCALDSEGKQRMYFVRAGDNGSLRADDRGKTESQKQSDKRAAFLALEPSTRLCLDKLGLPLRNCTQQRIIGDAMEGRPNYGNLRVVLGDRSIGEAFQVRFPGVTTVKQAAGALKRWKRQWAEAQSK